MTEYNYTIASRLYHQTERSYIMKKLLTLTLAAAMLVVSLVSCSSSESTGVKVIEIPLTEEEYAFGVDKDQPELLEATNAFIAKIKEDGTFDEICNNYFGDGEPKAITSATLDESKDQLVVATNAGFEPFEYTKGDAYYGIDMEIAALLAEELGKELVINNMDFDAVCLSVGQHKCDIAIAGLTVKEDRMEYVNFSDSYYSASQEIIVLESNTAFDNCKTAADVEAVLATYTSSTKAGCQNGTTAQFYLEGDADWGFDGFEITCTGYNTAAIAVQDLINGNIDMVVVDSAPAACIVKAYNETK